MGMHSYDNILLYIFCLLNILYKIIIILETLTCDAYIAVLDSYLCIIYINF